jgi:5-methylcytosine-specific restriction endonuclease McrA
MNKQRSKHAEHYRKLYMTKRWRFLRAEVLARDLFTCQQPGCGSRLVNGRSDPRSAVVHHKTPHKGELELFYDKDNLEAVCWTCHSGAIQSAEALGYDSTIGADGWPVDPKHPGSK